WSRFGRSSMAAEETRHYLTNGQATAPDAREALEWARETTAKMVDLKFCDLLGTWQHMTLPISAFDESAFDEGLGFDGSSIRGWQGISESDMLLMPDASSAILDPFTEAPTLSLICEIADPLTREGYTKDPRRIATRAEEYLCSTGIADTAYMGPECEFFVFDAVSYELGPNRSHYLVDSGEGHWNSGKPGLGYTVREKEGYFPPAPHDTLSDLRTLMVLTLERGHAAHGGQVRLRRAVAARARLRRRPARSCAGPAGVLRTDDELVPPARARLRGAGQPRLLAAEPQRVHPHPRVLGLAESEADRVPLPGCGGESVPRVRGDADGRTRRRAKRPRRRRAGRLGSLRGGPRRGAGAGLARRGARRAGSRSRLPHRGLRLQ